MINKIQKEIYKIREKCSKEISKKIKKMVKLSGVNDICLSSDNVYDDNNYYEALRFDSINQHVLIHSDPYYWDELDPDEVKAVIIKIKSKEEAMKIIAQDSETLFSDTYSDCDEFALQVGAICYEGEISYKNLIDLMTGLDNIEPCYLLDYMK